MKRKAVKVHQDLINKALRQSTEDLAHLNKVRNLARSITQDKVHSIDGQPEVRESLRLEDYPKAPPETAAKLMGISRDYNAYTNALIGLMDLDRFEVIDGGNATLKTSYIQEIEDEFTQYLEGTLLDKYNAIEAVCNQMHKANDIIGQPIASSLLHIDHVGNATPNLIRIMELEPRKPLN